MVSIDTLVKIYNNFGDREKLSPLGSADEEVMWNDKLTDKQVNWLERFIVVWDYATNLDVHLHKVSAMAKKGVIMAKIDWIKKISDQLVGRQIVKIEYCSKKEMEHQGWHNQPVQILLDNGIWLTPTSDDEGNNGGAIHTNIKELPIIPVIY